MRSPERSARWCGGGFQWNPPDSEWLEFHYLVLEKSMEKIASEVGVNISTIWGWLNDAQIPSRPRHKDGSTEGYFRGQARKTMQEAGVPKVCAHCDLGEGWFVEVHHLDGNYANNKLENLQYLCRSCHLREHYKRGDR